jgi:ribonuclease D
MSLITTTKDLKALMSRLKKEDYVTVDTEFIREKTYWPRLCLIQIAGAEEAFAIDPLAEDIELDSFYELMHNKDVLKVFHACRQDLEIFLNESGKLPQPVFDTQIAAMVCGFGEQASYESLVNALVKKTLDKTSRFTDWAQRPLTQKQLKYALADVIHLRPIFDKLGERLEKVERLGWIKDEMKDLLNKENYVTKPDEAWERIRIPTHKPRVLGILKELAMWREETARRVNVPRGRIMKDEALAEIATHPPKEREDLDKMRNLHKGFGASERGREVMEALQRGLDLPDDALPKRERREQLPQGIGPTADLLRVLLKLKCEEHDVAPKLLCSAADLEQIAAFGEEADVPALKGWRKTVFGKEALELRSGRLALAVEGGTLKLVKTA